MKIAPIAAELRRRGDQFEHVLVHTGQHYDRAMSKIFLDELGVGEPDHLLGVGSGSHAAADRARHGAARAGAPGGRAGRRARARRRELDDGRRAHRVEAAAADRARRGRVALVRPLAARGDQPHRRRPALPAALHPLAGGAGEPAGRGLRGAAHPRCREHDDRLAGRDAPADRELRGPGSARAERGEYLVVTLHRRTGSTARSSPTRWRGWRVAEELPVVFPVHPRTRAAMVALGIGPAPSGCV